MVANALTGDVLKQAQGLLAYAKESLEVVPSRLVEPVQDIVDTMNDYIHSDEEKWAEYRVAVPYGNVHNEFMRRLRMWRTNTTISFQDDEAPHLTLTQRALGTLADGGFDASLVAQESGIQVDNRAREAITYLDEHFLAHPYSAVIGDDGSVVFTILDSGYYQLHKFEQTPKGTSILTVDDLAQGIVMFAETNPAYADHLRSSMGDLYASETFHAEEYVGGFGDMDAKVYSADDIEGFGEVGGIGGFGNVGSSTPTPTMPSPATPATPATPTPAPAPTAYADKKSIPAKKVTDLPAEFLDKIREAVTDLDPVLAGLGQIGPRLTQFVGIEPCPPCHLHIPSENEDEAGECIDLCEEHETCVGGQCEEYNDPQCKPTMKDNIGENDRMCRIDCFNEVIAEASNDDGFAWRIAGQKQIYSTVIYDRYIDLKTPMLREVEQESFEQYTNNFTAGSAQPRPRMVSPVLMNGKGYRVPCPTAGTNPVKVHVTDSEKGMKRPTNFRFYKDSADNLYLECEDLKPGQMYDGTFIVELQYPNGVNQRMNPDKANLYEITETFADLKKKVSADPDLLPYMPPLDATAQGAADLVLNHISGVQKRKPKDFVYEMDSPIGVVIQNMVSWLDDFECEDIPRNKHGLSTTQLYLNTETGACRHRAYLAFLALNRLGLPTRFCGSTCHAWPEIWDYNNRLWIQIDLGGCGDVEPKGCPPCMKLNPLYGLNPDEEKCIPVECSEGYYCDPIVNKCIPDCAELYPDDPDYHYNPLTDQCEKCPDGRTWNPALNVCDCDVCPEGFSMVDGKCVDEDGDVSEEAPLGFYADPVTGMCLPIPDCETDRQGTVFSIETGQCECLDGPNPLDEEAPFVEYTWNDTLNECVPVYSKICADGEYWDEEAGRCRKRKVIDGGGSSSTTPAPVEDEEVEGLIMEEGKAKIKQTGLLNPDNGDIITMTDMRNSGLTTDSLKGDGYTSSWETVSVAKKGLNAIPISNTLHGILDWVNKQDKSVNEGKIEVLPLWTMPADKYKLVFRKVEGEDEIFDKFVETWMETIQGYFPTQFTLATTGDALVIDDARTA